MCSPEARRGRYLAFCSSVPAMRIPCRNKHRKLCSITLWEKRGSCQAPACSESFICKFYGIARDSLINKNCIICKWLKYFFISFVCSIPQGIFSCYNKLSVVSSFFLPFIHLKGKYLSLYSSSKLTHLLSPEFSPLSPPNMQPQSPSKNCSFLNSFLPHHLSPPDSLFQFYLF